MILMPVGDHKALHLIEILLQVRHVRNHQVDAEHIVAREGHAAVNHDDAVLVLEGSHVHADLLKAAQRDDLDLFVVPVLFFCCFQICLLTQCSVSTVKSISESLISSAKTFDMLSSSVSSSTNW